MKKVALFFGSFNPIHNGHMAVAERVLDDKLAEELWFVVSPQNPFKDAEELAPEGDRLEMVKIAVNGSTMKTSLRASDIEFGMPKPSYTINTLGKLWADYPDTEFSILMGADNLLGLEKWKDYGRIVKRCRIFVYGRKGCGIDKALLSVGDITILDAPLMDVSSTEIRKYSPGKCREYLPEGVYEYIKKHGLYGS